MRSDDCQRKVSYRPMLADVIETIRILCFVLFAGSIAFGQTTPASPEPEDSGTSNDLFVMFGSDLVRPGLLPKANYNVGLGHTFKFLKKDPIGDEITFAYTYENAGSHGFLHTNFGSHTEALGLMKNFGIPGTKRVSGYTWIQGGITSLTGNPLVQNRFYDGESLGAIVHFNDHHSIWIQETYNKIASLPWYTTASIGYTRSW
jgi:hypothetical protein